MRKIEYSSANLALISIKANSLWSGAKNHIFFSRFQKPPLDIAISPHKHTIEYISFYLQDEIIHKKKLPNICFSPCKIEITDSAFSDKITSVHYHKEFDLIYNGEDLIIMDKNAAGNFIAHELDKKIHILLGDKNDFSGLLLEQLKYDELIELQKSHILPEPR